MSPSSGIEIVLLRPEEVVVDTGSGAQREYRPHHAKAIAKNYSPALFGLGHVSLRSDGRYYVLDAQHRKAAAEIAGQGHIPVPFQVWRGLSIEEEARLFDELNANKLKVDAFNRFRVGVTAKNPSNVEIVRILESFGLSVGLNQVEGTVGAVESLIQVFEGKIRGGVKPQAKPRGDLPKGHLLSRTLRILTQAWGRDRNAFDGVLLKGVAALLYKHDARVEGTRFARALSRYDTPIRAIGKIRALSEAAGVAVTVAAVQYFEGVYNKNLPQDKRLE